MERGWVSTANVTDKNHNFPEVCISDNDCFLITESEHPEVQSLLQDIKTILPFTTVKRSLESSDELVKRARQRAAVVRLPKNRRTKFIAATYNTVGELVGKGRALWSTPVGKIAKNICLQNAASFTARQLGSMWIYLLLYRFTNMTFHSEICDRTRNRAANSGTIRTIS
jgi:hypothetical protein